jgi:hypothetical protein
MPDTSPPESSGRELKHAHRHARRFLAFFEDAAWPPRSHGREAARTRIFDSAQTLADALVDDDRSKRWEPLCDLIPAGLEARALRHAPDRAALRTAAGEFAAAALRARRVGRKTATTPDRHSAGS